MSLYAVRRNHQATYSSRLAPRRQAPMRQDLEGNVFGDSLAILDWLDHEITCVVEHAAS
jgi:hypothetical protein